MIAAILVTQSRMSEYMDMIDIPPEYMTGLEKVDSEHQRIYRIISLMSKSVADNRGSTITAHHTGMLLSYIKSHFENEEDIMIAIGFDGLNSHMEEHSIMLNKLSDLFYQHRMTGDITNALSYLIESLTEHMKREDKLLADHVQLLRTKKSKIAGARMSAR